MTNDAAPGILIGFDGVDSSGKETQAGLLAEQFRRAGRTVHALLHPITPRPVVRN